MGKLKISHAFAKMKNADLLAFSISVIHSLTDNANFPITNPPLADINVLADDFKVAIANAADGGKTLNEIKKQKRKLLIQGMYKLAGCITHYNNIDEAKLLSSGFKLFRVQPSVGQAPEKPVGLLLSDGPHSGTVQARCKVVERAMFYELRYTTDEFGPDAVWVHVPVSSKRTIIITGLKPGTKIWAQMRSINRKGYSEWSSPAMIIVR